MKLVDAVPKKNAETNVKMMRCFG